MGVYLRGEAITIVERFWTIDPVTEVATLADPDAVVFTVESPNGVQTAYVYGADPNVTRDSVGVYLCALDPPLPAGIWPYRCDGTGAVQASAEGTFTVLESGVLPPSGSTVATYGPCNDWIYGADVAEFDPTLGVGTNTFELDDVASDASLIMFEAGGRRFPGICERTVRPCRDRCGCFGGSVALGLGPWYWGGWSLGAAGSPFWGWRNECGDRCGCGNESYVDLAGYPVREILEVKIDGAALATTGEYRLDDRDRLIRLADVTDPDNPVDRFWPGCQDLSLDDDQPGTYSVRYTWGGDPPHLGKMAAAQLAAELWKAIPANAGTCQLPTRVTKVVRQGITYERIVPLAEMIRKGATGLQFVDAFVATVNPTGRRRASAVWSPDVQPYARKVGQQ